MKKKISITRNLFDKYTKEYLFPEIEVTEVLIHEDEAILYITYFTYLGIPSKYHNFLVGVLKFKEGLDTFTGRDLIMKGLKFNPNTINQYLSDLHALKWVIRKGNGEYKLKQELIFNKNKTKKLIIEIVTNGN